MSEETKKVIGTFILCLPGLIAISMALVADPIWVGVGIAGVLGTILLLGEKSG